MYTISTIVHTIIIHYNRVLTYNEQLAHVLAVNLLQVRVHDEYNLYIELHFIMMFPNSPVI